MSTLSPPSTCIYCDQPRSFTDEHLFPAGLGGDDRRFLLKELVCGHCNTEVFSKLETSFMRNSPVALGRIFMQPRGRGKGKKASIPSLETSSATVFDSDGNLLLEAELQSEGKAVVLPQAILTNSGVVIRGSDQERLRGFFAALQYLLTISVPIVEKSGRGKAARFRITSMSWNLDKFESGETSYARKPPQQCLWRAQLQSPSATEEVHRFPTLFQRSTGQLVFRVPENIEIGQLLAQLRSTVLAVNDVCIVDGTPIEQPALHLGFSMDIDAYPRVLAKIGVNLAIHVLGESVVRNSCFDEVKDAILTGSSNVRFFPMEAGEAFAPIFASVPRDRHVMALVAQKFDPRQFPVVFLIRLYGGPIHMIHLAENAPIPPTVILPAFFTVDYMNHQIERFEPLDFFQAFPPVFPIVGAEPILANVPELR